MNKQEQIEKMARTMCNRSSCEDCGWLKDGRCDYYDCEVKMLISAGYVNGADFVEWLKKSGFIISFDNSIDIDDLDAALQEYLKGDSK